MDPDVPVALAGDSPYYRLQSSICVDEELDLLMLFGGFDQDDIIDDHVYLLDLKANKWLDSRKCGIFREGHSMTSLSSGSVLVYGGLAVDDQYHQHLAGQNAVLNGLPMLIYNMVDDVWTSPESRSPDNGSRLEPISISRHSTCLSRDRSKVYISGGYNVVIKEEPVNDLYCYEFATNKWDRRTFVSRFDHFVYESGNKIWSFGGLSKQMNHVKKISMFDLDNNAVGELKLSNMPKMLTGNHTYLKISDHKVLDIFTSQWSLDQETIKPSIGLFDLQKTKYIPLITGSLNLLTKFRWRHFFIHNDSLCMLGYPLTPETNDTSYDYRMTHLMKIPLANLGASTKTDTGSTDVTLLSSFHRLYNHNSFTDFRIVAINSFTRPEDDNDMYERSDPINVHKLVLITRWPYFKKLYESGMAESQLNEMFIPEPVGWVSRLVEYFYTNSIDNCTIDEMSGLLLLSEMYELSELKSMLLSQIYADGFKLNTILEIWKIAVYLDDPILRSNCESFIFQNWGKLVKTSSFKKLDKQYILRLFEGLDNESKIVSDEAMQRKVKFDDEPLSTVSSTYRRVSSRSPQSIIVEEDDPQLFSHSNQTVDEEMDEDDDEW
ncbi:hypothetical protein OGAPHI_006492 [Ogataea philodendri]|uniref:BTB domain-containing protein n=1 Tax=Ogataea philodendri TaxID=1378263 RepID=A0A9P8NY73_9ASCO|nr:uncharacterized protein OGAPHI_006492 [Ogataea philodendri]KAH3661642.1 hypothetical protein OGAPHI_006492 [Ogataea philodendri]